MMVNDLQDLCIFHVVHRLRDLIVINQDERSLAHCHHIPPRYGTDITTVVIDNRKVAVALLHHGFLDHIGVFVHSEGHQIVGLHKEIDRHTLVDQTGYRISIQIRHDHRSAMLSCHMLNRL